MLKTKRKKLYVFIPYAVALVLFFLLYSYSFPQGDDFIFASRGGTLPRIWDYYLNYYAYAGSRMANVLASILFLCGLSLWKVLTPLVIEGTGLLLFYCVTGHILPRENHMKQDLALAAACAFFPGFVPLAYQLFADTFLWADGSCNYLYPMFFLLLGFLPFWNTLRNRPLPKILKIICPVSLLISCLLHEQTVLALFAFCGICVFIFWREKRCSKYLVFQFAMVCAATIFTFTCPGAYYRLGLVNSGKQTDFLHRLFYSFLNYFSQFSNELWIFASLLGLCAVFLLHKCPGKFARLLSLFLTLGLVVAPLSQVFPILKLQANSSYHGPRTLVLLAYWVFFFAALIPAFLLPARQSPKKLYFPALYGGIVASQLIPLAIGSVGRPLFSFLILTLLLVLCTADEAENPMITRTEFCAALCSFCILAGAFPSVISNFAAYQAIEKQIEKAKLGETRQITMDINQFNTQYCYYRSFVRDYDYDIRQFYGLGKDIQLNFSK
jgi:hypothetical protein